MKKSIIILFVTMLIIIITTTGWIYLSRQETDPLQEIPNQISQVDSSIFYENTDFDINKDKVNDDIRLLITEDNNIDLHINKSVITLDKVESSDQVLSNINDDHFEYNLFQDNRFLLVESNYHFVNKFGSLSDLLILE